MALENYTGNIADLVVTNPTPTDPKSQGDDHLRGIKYTLKHSFPNFDGPTTQLPGQVTPDTVTLGDNAPASGNHFWDGSVANQLTLKRGTPGAPGTTVMQAVNGVVSFPAGLLQGVEVVTGPSGIALKFGDGTLICFISGSVAIGTWTAAATADFYYASFGGVGLYPIPFIATPLQFGFAEESQIASRSAYVSALTTDLAGNTGGFLTSPSGTTPTGSPNMKVNVIAVGRWKV